MIPCIKAVYLKMFDEFQAHRHEVDMPNILVISEEERANMPKVPDIWVISEEEIAYMEQIETVDDLTNYTPSQNGHLQALAWDCAKAMGLSDWDAGSVAGDH